MADRKYSLEEIDRMRAALHSILTPIGISYHPDSLTKSVEEQLRTYMMNGTDPEELETRAREMLEEAFRRRRDT